ncbi:BCCT family transporter [Escherichia coli]
MLFSLTTILFRDFSALWIGRTLDWVSKTFGWYYLLAATLYIVFVVCIACSRFGSVKLGPEQSKTGIQPAELGGDAVLLPGSVST